MQSVKDCTQSCFSYVEETPIGPKSRVWDFAAYFVVKTLERRDGRFQIVAGMPLAATRRASASLVATYSRYAAKHCVLESLGLAHRIPTPQFGINHLVGDTTPQGVTVRGQATALIAPDYAVLQVTVRARATSGEQAFEALAPKSAGCDTVLATHEAIVRRRETSSLGVEPVVEYEPQTGQAVQRGHTAWRSLRIEIRPTDGVAQMLTALVGEGAELAGPHWRVENDNPVHDDVRREAAADARRRAESYAAGLSLNVGGVAWASEIEETSGQIYGKDAMMSARAASAEAAGDAVELAVDEVEVRAALTVSFRILT